MKNTLVIVIKLAEAYKSFALYGANVAKDLDMDLHFLYPYSINPSPFSASMGAASTGLANSGEAARTHREISINKIKNVIQNVKKMLPDPPAMTFSVSEGDEQSLISDLINKDKCHMVVCMNDSAEGIFSVSGSTLNLLRNLECPVLAIPGEIVYKPLRKILYATDYKAEDIATLNSLHNLLQTYNPAISAFHISNHDEFDAKVRESGFKNMISEKTGSSNIKVESLINKENRPVDELLDIKASREKIDLLVLLKENKSFLERIYKASTTEKLLTHTRIPVMVFHESSVKEMI